MAKKTKVAVDEANQIEMPVEQEESKAVAVKEESLPQVDNSQMQNAWGAAPISAKDIIIPRILLMQPMSDLVTNGGAAFGEFRESLTNEKMGNFESAFEIVPFHMRKIWVESDVTAGTGMKDKKFLRVVPVTPQNESLPYNDEEKGEDGKMKKIMRDYVMEFFVLLKEELKNEAAIPYILACRRSSISAGKKLATQMYVKNHAAGKVPPAVVCKVISKKESNDQGTFAVMDIVPSEPSKNDWIIKAFEWFQKVNSGAAKVDEASYANDVSEVSQSASVSDGPGDF